MIITPHLLIGATIGAKIKNFAWIIVLGLFSHLILDKIPHWDYGKKIEKIPWGKTYYKIIFITLFEMLIDGSMGVLIVLSIIWSKNITQVEQLIFIFIGILFSLLPDFILGINKLSYRKFKFSKKYVDIHDKFLHYPKHIRKPTPFGVGTEILVSLIAILILIFS